jgi:hypothetical protein
MFSEHLQFWYKDVRYIHPCNLYNTQQTLHMPWLMHVCVPAARLQALSKISCRCSYLLAVISINSIIDCSAVIVLWVWLKHQLLMLLIADCARLYVQV